MTNPRSRQFPNVMSTRRPKRLSPSVAFAFMYVNDWKSGLFTTTSRYFAINQAPPSGNPNGAFFMLAYSGFISRSFARKIFKSSHAARL